MNSGTMADTATTTTPSSVRSNWQELAACRGLSVEVFYHPDAERGRAKRSREVRAKAVCATCPVAIRCLEWALSIREPYGIWGGTSPEERIDLLSAVAPDAHGADPHRTAA
jgi:WhiB family transcriptional regulator, redox-sensing transcriptional regulator